jgi:exosortase A
MEKMKNLSNNSNNIISIIVVSAVIGIFFYSTLQWLVVSWLNNDYYSHGFLIPLISGYLIYNMRDDLKKIEKKQTQEGLFVFIGGMIMYGIGSLNTIRFISGLSLLVTIFGLILYLYGWKFINKIKFPLLFLIFMIPLPIIDIAAPPAQTIAATGSFDIAKLIGLPIQRDGNQLILPSGTFEVAVECSGLNSLISLLALSTIYAFILEGGLLRKLTIFFSSIPLAMAGNILRITSVLIIGYKYGSDVAEGYFHQFSSLVLFSVALMGLFIVGRIFGKLKFKNIF